MSFSIILSKLASIISSKITLLSLINSNGTARGSKIISWFSTDLSPILHRDKAIPGFCLFYQRSGRKTRRRAMADVVIPCHIIIIVSEEKKKQMIERTHDVCNKKWFFYHFYQTIIKPNHLHIPMLEKLHCSNYITCNFPLAGK